MSSIFLTGGSGVVGRALLPLLLDAGHSVRAFVRDPRALGPDRVRVQIALGDLADPRAFRNSLRGVDAVIHLAASTRDQPGARIEELNGLATGNLLRAAESAGVGRFLFFSALGASEFQRTRFFRAKALAERAVLRSPLETTVFAPSLVYDPDDRWVRLTKRLALLPVLPVSGSGAARYQPIWARDAARCLLAALDGGQQRYELAGPETLSYARIVELVAASAGRHRPLLRVPLPLVRSGLVALRRLAGPHVFATWEEAELFEVPMTTPRGTEDARALGVDPSPLAEVLGQ